MEFSAKQIASFIQGEIVGDENATIHTFAKIEEGIPGAISFLSNPKYTPYIYDTKASIVLVNKEFVPEREVKATLIKVDNAYESLAKLLALYEQSKPQKKGIDSLASIAPSAQIGEDVYIGPFAVIGEGAVIGSHTRIYPHTYIGDHAKIGENCLLYSGVNVYHDCRIGNNCTLHSGSVIGADGFGFAPTPEGYEKIPQIGIVILEDNVEIGANTCIDRATMGATIIHSGVKLDNQIQIGHNCHIGENSAMAGCVGVAGSAIFGKHCTVGGAAMIGGHLTIADRVHITASSVVQSSVKEAGVYSGFYPLAKHTEWEKTAVLTRKLGTMRDKIRELEKTVQSMIKKEK